jgi:DMSO reductase anchor subunit
VIRDRHTSTTHSAETFVPASPDAAYTLPTTTFVSKKTFPRKLHAADAATVRPAQSHWPLVFMLVLTQAGIGGVWFETARYFATNVTSTKVSLANAALILIGMAASIFHLGRPLQSWRAFMGMRRSWLSREIVALNALAFGVLLPLAAEVLPISFTGNNRAAAFALCSLAGAAALLSSIMVYVDTPRFFWRWQETVPRFTGSALLLGGAGAAIVSPQSWLFALISVIAILRTAHELLIFRKLSGANDDPLARSARLMTGPLSKVTAFRFLSLLTGGVVLSQAAIAQGGASTWIAPTILITLLASEIAERSLFFRAVAQPKMPGGVA